MEVRLVERKGLQRRNCLVSDCEAKMQKTTLITLTII
jgi:hypothetical protein